MNIKLLIDGIEVPFHNDVKIIVEEIDPDNDDIQLHLTLNDDGFSRDIIAGEEVREGGWCLYEDLLQGQLLGHRDGEVLGVDTDGCIIQWSTEDGKAYNCGQTPEEFGLDNLTEAERRRVQ